MKCQGLVAIVTGATGSGIGRSVALTLGREHASVVVNFRSHAEDASEIVQHIQHMGGKAASCQADVFTQEGCSTLVQRAEEEFGRVDICVVSPGGDWRPGRSLLNSDPNEALEEVKKELAPFYYLAALILPGMHTRQIGRFVAIAMNTPLMGAGDYSLAVAKAVRRSALELASSGQWSYGVTMNVVSPGGLRNFNDFTEAVSFCEHRSGWRERLRATPQDVAECVALLCSEEGRFITNAVIPVQPHAKNPGEE